MSGPDSRSGWLDEAWTGVLVLPILLAFLPWTQDAAARGFAILAHDVPLWYQAAWGVAVGWGFARPALNSPKARAKGNASPADSASDADKR